MRIQDFVVVQGSVPTAGNPGQGTQETIHAAIHAAAAMKQQDDSELRAQLARLRQEHRDLDAAIEALHNAPSGIRSSAGAAAEEAQAAIARQDHPDRRPTHS
jgi:hypothetical protein